MEFDFICTSNLFAGPLNGYIVGLALFRLRERLHDNGQLLLLLGWDLRLPLPMPHDVRMLHKT